MTEGSGIRADDAAEAVPPPAGLPANRLLVLFLPFIAVGIVAAGVAMVAALMGWHREEMLLAAGTIAVALVVPTIVYLYRQRAERDMAQRALENVRARVGGIVESAMDAIVTVDETQRV
ncbi:MAG TPA: hypothetical protein VNU21_15900, partial [Usitatibacter sp.]|nr:hypothetical protein [Usitatibacter sp.]